MPTSITLKVLHEIIQVAMGWFDYHLWAFRSGGRRYGPPREDLDRGGSPMIDARKVRLRDVLRSGETVLDYIYDFGDGWEHRITVTNVRTGDPDVAYPHYVGGERAAPPEDCGGTAGFYELLEAAANPKHSNHADAQEWLDEYDPEEVDELAIQYALARIANRRRAAQNRVKKAQKH